MLASMVPSPGGVPQESYLSSTDRYQGSVPIGATLSNLSTHNTTQVGGMPPTNAALAEQRRAQQPVTTTAQSTSARESLGARRCEPETARLLQVGRVLSGAVAVSREVELRKEIC